jgi:glycosyltransferase involved in cell wall biosynthesis
MTKVSIIIPVYNAEKYLDECIDSVINQTYSDIEIIAVNDGSTDRSLDILKKYSDTLKIISKDNGGLASARNAGINVAKGEWIKPLDADDILYPKAVEELVSAANEFEDKTHTILYANFDYVDHLGKLMGQKIEPNYNDLNSFDFNTILLDHYIGLIDTLLFHRSTIEKYGMYNELIDYPDYELLLSYCLIHNCRLRLVSKRVAKYRIHKGSITWIDKKLADANKTRKFVLDKLDSIQRKKYENALKHYSDDKPLIAKVEDFLGRKILRLAPGILSTQIEVAYHNIKQKFKKENN